MKNWKIKHVISIILVVVLIITNVACYNFKNVINLYLAKANTADEETMNQVTEQAKDIVQEIEGEGIVLLDNKNNTLPLNKDTNLNIFGWGSVAPVYGGNGSGASNATANVTLQQGLENAGLGVNGELTKFYTDLGFARQESGPLNDFAPDYRVYEADAALYTEELLANAKAFSDTAIVMITRVGGEGSDLAPEMGDWEGDKGRHFLELTSKEESMLEIVKENFETVVVLVNSSNAMELAFLEQEDIDAALWIGGPGQTGMNAVGQVLVGDINPSGALVDTYAYDATSSPAYQNFGDFEYSNATFGPENNWFRKYVDYQEGIYVGYRYYETRFVDNATGECDEEAYGKMVQYPFGYGLSYTTFEQETTGFKANEDKIEVEVKVTNTGDVAGKEIVQVYHTAPYTEGGIEKSHVVLSAFGKTNVLEPGKSETLTLEIPIEEMASYDYKDAKAYVLEAGDYEIKLMDNAHDVIDSNTYNVAETITYGEGNKRESDEITATNVFDYAAGDVTYLSRADWEGTFPTAVEKRKEASQQIIDELNDETIVNNDADVDIIIKDHGLELIDMVGLDYNDPKWNELLEQISVEEMQKLIGFGGYATVAVDSIKKPATVDIDGPAGLNALVNESTYNGVSYTSEVVMASTWNTDLVYAMGKAYGEEAKAWGVSGIYGPSMNGHRTPFSGRNFEYYSEDGFLSGKMGASEVKGIMEAGVYTYVKHFALNDQETHRAGIATWSNEQAIREIYLKPFELATKEGGTTAIMSSFNRIGTLWAGANSDLLQTILRDEWGFEGMVITDYDGYPFMNPDMAIRSGNDLMLSTLGDMPQDTSNTGKQAMRKATHNILYTVANSVAMGAGTGASMPAWVMLLAVINVIVIGGIVLSYVLGNRAKKKKAIVE